MRVALTIAGSDSGGGAGIQADLKTFEAHGLFGTTALTGITAQNTVGVRAVFDLPIEIVCAQIDAVLEDFDVAAIKIGMLSTRDIVAAVAAALRRRAAGIPIVLDPVMVATSGDRLVRSDAVRTIVAELLPLATLVTPNADEASILAGIAVDSVDRMSDAARRIVDLGARAALVKGGHIRHVLPGEKGRGEAVDLFFDGERERRFHAPFIETRSTHGTGCTLSSAIAANLALGFDPDEAIGRAKDYVHGAIDHAPGLGHGHGPLLHRWRDVDR